MKNVGLALAMVLLAASVNATVADFDDLSGTWSGNYTVDEIGGNYDTTYFNSGSASFENHSDGDWWSWSGFAYSNMTDTTTPGYGNQLSTYAGQAHSGSNFAVGYQDSYNGYNPTMILDNTTQLAGFYVTNTTYTGLDMLNGNPGLSNRFGYRDNNGDGDYDDAGDYDGDYEDWFLLTITGKDALGATLGTVDFYLADYRFADNGQDYILDTWEYVDLTSLGTVKSLELSFTSSDNGAFGMNTPAYVAVDTVVPEPATLALLGLGAMVLRRKM